MANYALIKENKVQNVVVIDEQNENSMSYLDAQKQTYDHVIKLDTLEVDIEGVMMKPGMNWGYDGESWTPPVAEPEGE